MRDEWLNHIFLIVLVSLSKVKKCKKFSNDSTSNSSTLSENLIKAIMKRFASIFW
jgi:hypothetical protein